MVETKIIKVLTLQVDSVTEDFGGFLSSPGRPADDQLSVRKYALTLSINHLLGTRKTSENKNHEYNLKSRRLYNTQRLLFALFMYCGKLLKF